MCMIFRVAIKTIKGFQNMGTDVKLLFKQLVTCPALRAIPQYSPPPISCAENQKHSELVYQSACGKCVPFSLHYVSRIFARSSLPPLTLHFTIIPIIHLSTARHKYSFYLSTCYVPSVAPMPFPNAIPAVCFHFCDE